MPDLPATYSATLRADRRLRAVVLGSGGLFLCAGVAIIAGLPAVLPLRILGLVAWSGWVALDLWQSARAYRSVIAVVLRPDGSLDVQRADGSREAGQLAAGSVSLARVAWLRVAVPSQRSWGEPIRCTGQDREHWRRFQVICRHLAA